MGMEQRQSAGSDRVGGGLMLVLLGISPWVWLAGVALISEFSDRATPSDGQALAIGIGALVAIGALSMIVALLLGLVSHVRYVRRRRAESQRAEGAPAPVDRPPLTTQIARIAAAIGIVVIGGGFGAIAIAPITPYDGWSARIDADPRPVSYAVAALTILALVAGLLRLSRSHGRG